MQTSEFEPLTDELELALAHSPKQDRERLWAMFALDQRLARIVAKATEPMLAQMRLSWWREMLQSPPDQRPEGDQVLDAISAHCKGAENSLIGLVDGWEHLLAEPPIQTSEISAFADGRARAISALDPAGSLPKAETRFNLLGRIWALADLAAKVGSNEEKATILSLAEPLCAKSLPSARDYKALAILSALGRRAIRRGGRPLLEGRGAALVAARAALLGK